MNIDQQYDQKFIGDEIKIKGIRYMVTANYPRDGYLLAKPSKVDANIKRDSLKLKYA